MEYTYLGRSGLRVSRLCLGTMNFGLNTDEKEAFAIMDKALDAGINFFDTADMYGSRGPVGTPGLTEEIMGRWFKQGGNRREKVVLATKFSENMRNEVDGPNGETGLSAFKLRRHLDDSLRRLQTDHVELLYMHNHDDHSGWDEIWDAYEVQIAQGKVDYAASSNFSAFEVAECHFTAKERRHFGLVCHQFKYNLLCRLPELELIPACRKMGLGMITWSPLMMGKLTGGLFKPMLEWQRTLKYKDQLSEAEIKQLKDYSDLCHDIGEEEASVAMAWVLAQPGITAPIIGPRTVEQLEDTLHALDVKLSEDVLKRLDEIFPTQGSAPAPYIFG